MLLWICCLALIVFGVIVAVAAAACCCSGQTWLVVSLVGSGVGWKTLKTSVFGCCRWCLEYWSVGGVGRGVGCGGVFAGGMYPLPP